MDLLNLFDSKRSDADYLYISRLRGEPIGGVEGIHFHPVEPFTVRLALLAILTARRPLNMAMDGTPAGFAREAPRRIVCCHP